MTLVCHPRTEVAPRRRRLALPARASYAARVTDPEPTRRPTAGLWSRLAIAVVFGGLALWLNLLEPDPTYADGSLWPPIDAAIGLLSLPAVIYRHRWPMAMLVITALLAGPSIAATGPAVVVAVSVCAGHRWGQMVAAGLATCSSSVIFTLIHIPEGERTFTIAWGIALSAVVVAVGWLLGVWRENRRAAWSIAWRMALALAVGLLLYAAVLSEGSATGYREGQFWQVLDPLVGMVAIALIPLRRRWPLAIVIVTSLLAATAATASGAALLVLASVSTTRDWRKITIGALVNLGTGLLFGVIHDIWGGLTDVVTNTSVVALCVTIGLFIGARRELVDNLRAQVETARREQEARVAQARTSERARIAREMHDVLAHRISTVAMHAGALSYRDDLPPDQVRRTAELLQETSHQALIELREVLGVLREQDSPTNAAPEPPQPTLADLAELVEAARINGQDIDVQLSIESERLPTPLSRNAFRIVQESLTNARKHAPHAPVTIRLSGNPGGELDMEVRNPTATPTTGVPATPGAGLGLVGLRERATLSGGTLSATTDRQHDFVVRAILPWPFEEENTA